MSDVFVARAQCGGCGRRLSTEGLAAVTAPDIDRSRFYSSSSSPLSVSLTPCDSCGLVQTAHLLNRQELEDAYAEALDDDHSSQFEHRRESFRRALRRSVLPHIPEGIRSPWLDVGTAGGAFVAAARDLALEAIGLEPSGHIVAQVDHSLRPYVRQGFLSNLTAGERFGVVSYWDVLEHVSDPREEVERAKTHLNSRGFLVLNLPMIDTSSARILRRRWPFYLDVHLTYFTRETVEHFLDSLGFDLVSMRTYTQTLDLRYLLSRYSGRVKIPAVLARVPVRYAMGQRTIVARWRS